MVGVGGLVASQSIWFLVLGRFAGRAGVHSFDATRLAPILWSVLVEDHGLVARKIIHRALRRFRPPVFHVAPYLAYAPVCTMLLSGISAGRCSVCADDRRPTRQESRVCNFDKIYQFSCVKLVYSHVCIFVPCCTVIHVWHIYKILAAYPVSSRHQMAQTIGQRFGGYAEELERLRAAEVPFPAPGDRWDPSGSRHPTATPLRAAAPPPPGQHQPDGSSLLF